MTEAAVAEQSVNALKEEYGSITITIDHLVTDDHGGHVVVKCVFSSESAVESLLSQFNYFGQNELLKDTNVRRMIAEGEDSVVAYVYTPSERQTNVIVDGPLWSKTLADENLGGTVLSAHSSFIAMALDMIKAARAADKPTTLLAFVAD